MGLEGNGFFGGLTGLCSGITFPPPEKAVSSAAMIETTTVSFFEVLGFMIVVLTRCQAPEWTDSEVCMRCRTQFTTFNRKHHCRNCGQTFCGQCSSKNLALPHLGIVQEVRVCDGCHLKLSTKSPPGTPKTQRRSSTTTSNQHHDVISKKEEDDLQKALALSLEASRKQTSTSVSRASTASRPKPKPVVDDDEDEDLKAAIAASLQDLNVNDYTDGKTFDRPGYEYKRPAATSSKSGYPSSSQHEAVSSYGSTQGGDHGPRPADRVSSYASSSTPAHNPNELSAVELENIRLFSELVERTEADVAAHGLGVLSNSQIQVCKVLPLIVGTGMCVTYLTQTLYAQIGTLQPKLARNLDETVRKYRQFCDLNEQVTGVVKEYDRLLQQRLAAAGYGQGYATPASSNEYQQYGGPGAYQQQPGYAAQAPVPQSAYAPGYAAPGYYPPGSEQQQGGPTHLSQPPAGMPPQAPQQFYAPQQGQAPGAGVPGVPPSQQYDPSQIPPQAPPAGMAPQQFYAPQQGQVPAPQQYDPSQAPPPQAPGTGSYLQQYQDTRQQQPQALTEARQVDGYQQPPQQGYQAQHAGEQGQVPIQQQVPSQPQGQPYAPVPGGEQGQAPIPQQATGESTGYYPPPQQQQPYAPGSEQGQAPQPTGGYYQSPQQQHQQGQQGQPQPYAPNSGIIQQQPNAPPQMGGSYTYTQPPVHSFGAQHTGGGHVAASQGQAQPTATPTPTPPQPEALLIEL